MEQLNGNTRQRLVRSEEQILALLEEYDKSGFNVKDFCEVSDINEATFYSWIKKYRNKPDDEVRGFASIEVIPASDSNQIASNQPQLFAEVGSIQLYKEVSAEYLKALLS